MKLFKWLISLFSKEKEDVGFYEPLAVAEIGQAEEPVFVPQTLLSFYCLHKVIHTKEIVHSSIQEIKLLELYHPLTQKYQETAFGIKQEKGWIWAQIGDRTAYFSSFKSFKYKETDTYRVLLKNLSGKRSLFAVCNYTDGEVQVVRLMVENDKTQGKAEIPNTLCPCDLPTAAEFAKNYQA